jgi:hypothetical protein
MLCFPYEPIEDSIVGFFVDRYDTIWYMRLRIDNFTPKDRGGVGSLGPVQLGAARMGSHGVVWNFVHWLREQPQV